MSSSALKLIALLLMIFDHTVSCFQIGSEIGVVGSITVYTLLRWMTRMSYPLFAFGIVEGFRKTSNRKKYGIRLFIFALVSQIPWSLEHTGEWMCGSLNVMFTLFLGFLGLCVVEKLKEQADTNKAETKLILALAALFTIVCWWPMDYGVRGFGIILLMYLLDVGKEKNLAKEAIAAVGCSVALNNAFFVIPTFILIHFYNGEVGWMKGKLRYLFYLVYPAQFLVLWYLKYIALI